MAQLVRPDQQGQLVLLAQQVLLELMELTELTELLQRLRLEL